MKTYRQLLENIKVKYPFGTPVLIDKLKRLVEDNEYHEIMQHIHTKYPQNPSEGLQDHYALKHLSDDEKKYLHSYTITSANVNNSLWRHHIYKEPIPTGVPERVTHLDSTMKKIPLGDHLGKLHLWSGVRFHPGMKAAKGGGKLFMPAFTSTSLDFEIARSFAEPLYKGQETNHHEPTNREHIEHHMILFHTHPGHHGFFTGKNSAFPLEKEFILPRNLSVHLNPTPETYKMIGMDYHIWHAHTAEDSPHVHNQGIEEPKNERINRSD